MLIEKGDPAWKTIDLGTVQPTLCADLPRLREGRVGAQYWSIFTDAENAHKGTSLHEAVREIDVVLEMIRRHPELELARSADDIERIHRAGRIASLMGIEGGHMIEDSLGVLRIFHRLGARYMTLTHWNNVPWADAATDRPEQDGLSERGEEIVREMNRLGMFVDISHVSPATMLDVLRVSRAPVIFSHSNARAVAGHVRNVPDEVLRLLPANGGVVHVNFLSSFVARGDAAWQEARTARLEELRAALDESAGHRRRHRRMGEAPIRNPGGRSPRSPTTSITSAPSPASTTSASAATTTTTARSRWCPSSPTSAATPTSSPSSSAAATATKTC